MMHNIVTKVSSVIAVILMMGCGQRLHAQSDIISRNKAEEKEFMAKNRENRDVKTVSSGLQYKIENKGGKRKPKATDDVYVKYKGYFVDGTVFDSSMEEPAIFRLNSLISGMTEGLSMLGVGGKATLYIPSRLAYGETGTDRIEPCKMLIFEIEVLDIYNEMD